MTEEKWSDSRSGFVSPRYVLMSLMSTVLVAAGGLGYMSDKPEIGSLLGDYQGMLQGNWQLLLAAGIIVGVLNLLLTLNRK